MTRSDRKRRAAPAMLAAAVGRDNGVGTDPQGLLLQPRLKTWLLGKSQP
jgi:hypothetical protein